MKLIIFIAILTTNLLIATPIDVEKDSYQTNENIIVHVMDLSGDKKDWVGIYPIGTTNEWKNVVSWAWTNNNRKVILPKISKIGQYEARVFFRNSYKLEGTSKSFEIKESINQNPKIIINSYDNRKCFNNIDIKLENMGGNTNDWIALYPIDSNNEWKNVKAWQWMKNITNSNIIFKYPETITRGTYELRAFFNNSFHLEARSNPIFLTNCENAPKLTTVQPKYFKNETITVNFSNMSNDKKNWIGIYKAGKKTLNVNNLDWKWTNDKINGKVSFDNLPVGKYDVRAFFKNSYEVEALISFEIVDKIQENFPKDLLRKGENPTRGVYVFYNNNKAFISVDSSSLYFNEHRGITAVDYSDKNNPHITAYQPDQVARKNTIFLNEEKNILTFLNEPYSLTSIVTIDANTLDIIDSNDGGATSSLSYFKEDGLNLFYTARSWAEQPIIQYYYIDNNGMILTVALGSNGSDYNYLKESGRIGKNKYYLTHRIRNWDRDGKWESHKKIYDISNLPEVVLLDTIIFDVQP